MRHRNAGKKLSADTQHRAAMRRNLARALFLKGRIVTTPAKAKAVRPYVEKLVTRARRAAALGTADRPAYVHQVRLLAREVPDRQVLRLLVERIAPMCKDRPGGYVRIIHEARRQVGSAAPLAILEFVDRPAAPEEGAEGAAEAAAGDKKGAKARKAAGRKAASTKEGAGAKGGRKRAAEAAAS